MRPEAHTARAYLLVDQVVQLVEAWLSGKPRSICGYKPGAVQSRLAQIVAMNMVDPFLRQTIQDDPQGRIQVTDALPHNLHCADLQIDTKTGKVNPGIILFLSSIAKFVALWLLVLGKFLMVRRLVVNGPATLTHGVPEADLLAGGNAGRFENFCRNGELEIFSAAHVCIVQAVRPIVSKNPDKFVYSRVPLLSLFAAHRMQIADCLRFLRQHGSAFWQYLFLAMRHPIACLLWRDIALHAVAAALDRKGMIAANVITNTNWLQQFLWMTDLPDRRFKTYMTLYSLNSATIMFKDNPLVAAHPGIRHLRADLIYIWDARYEQALNEDGVHCKTQVVSPVLWYLPEPVPKKRVAPVCRFCVFDVSPVRTDALRSRGMLGNYYTVEVMKKFLDDILAVAQEAGRLLGCEVEIVIKHKRTPSPTHDRSYFTYVNDLSVAHPNFRLTEEDANLFSLIADSNVAIVIPFSSPAYVANHLGVPAIYYDPSTEVVPSNAVIPPATFAAGPAELLAEVMRVMAADTGLSKKAIDAPPRVVSPGEY
jgi:hypothetical protein